MLVFGPICQKLRILTQAWEAAERMGPFPGCGSQMCAVGVHIPNLEAKEFPGLISGLDSQELQVG